LFSTRSDLEGVPSTRIHRPYKAFEAIVDRVLGDRVRANGAYGVDLWCALANVEWRSPDGHMIFYSFRRAGELVAWVREDGDGMDWYCSGAPAVVADWISDALAEAGWSWTTTREQQG
jgi:hypothetical protein